MMMMMMMVNKEEKSGGEEGFTLVLLVPGKRRCRTPFVMGTILRRRKTVASGRRRVTAPQRLRCIISQLLRALCREGNFKLVVSISSSMTCGAWGTASIY
ncbi:hypothetical protein HPP92_006908 [Vanilla planifolia]|uniref:Uncharacterized protein n=1 Tax=Vanilla planifolia TaxID=51239 RepID=A0A835VAR5_VANPL|nr:hypothetical protein HPP92_006908 [Vanilla planifolia]